MALTDKLVNIADAIRSKTNTTEKISLDDMPSKIEGISAAENLTEELNAYNNELLEQETTIEDIMEALKDKGIGEAPKYAPRYIYTMTFREYTGTELDYEVANLDTNNITDMSYMFYNCSKLTELDLSEWNTGKVRNFRYMFYRCAKLRNLNVKNFDTSSATDMSYFFQNCSSLESLNLSSFNTTNVTNMGSMFNGCNNITLLDLSAFNTSKVTNMSSMFDWCSNLKELDIRNFDFTKVTNYGNMFKSVPTGCEIIVKDDTAKEWITSKFTTLTNVKTVAEL